MRAHELAKALGGRLLGSDVNLLRLAPLSFAGASDLALVIWPKDIRKAKRTKAGCLIAEIAIAAEYADEFPSSLIAITNLAEGFDVLKVLMEEGHFTVHRHPLTIADDASIHPSAKVGKASIGKGAVIGAQVVIEDGVIIGEGCRIDVGVVIKRDAFLGPSTRIGANSVIGGEAFT